MLYDVNTQDEKLMAALVAKRQRHQQQQQGDWSRDTDMTSHRCQLAQRKLQVLQPSFRLMACVA